MSEHKPTPDERLSAMIARLRGASDEALVRTTFGGELQYSRAFGRLECDISSIADELTLIAYDLSRKECP